MVYSAYSAVFWSVIVQSLPAALTASLWQAGTKQEGSGTKQKGSGTKQEGSGTTVRRARAREAPTRGSDRCDFGPPGGPPPPVSRLTNPPLVRRRWARTGACVVGPPGCAPRVPIQSRLTTYFPLYCRARTGAYLARLDAPLPPPIQADLYLNYIWPISDLYLAYIWPISDRPHRRARTGSWAKTRQRWRGRGIGLGR